MRFCVPDLQPGFDVVSDLTKCGFAFLDIIPTFKNILNYFVAYIQLCVSCKKDGNLSGENICILTKALSTE